METSRPANGKKSNKTDKKKSKPREYNARWRGYLAILLFSLISLSSISNVLENSTFDGSRSVAVTFGAFSFGLVGVLLLADRTKFLSSVVDYTKAFKGKLEGGTLLFLVCWWTVGVGYITQVNGLAYTANNVYFSCWLSLASSLYTLNEWSSAKDILSFDELTSISETLKPWYVLFLSSLVVTGTSLELFFEVNDDFQDEAVLGIGLGLGSFILSFFWICTHYKFITIVQEGSWLEFGSAFCAILIWIVGCSVLTRDGAVGATLVGMGCHNSETVRFYADALSNCTVNFLDTSSSLESVACSTFLSREIPGSNLYLSIWTCMGASVSITLRWKVQQARRFAQAQSEKATQISAIDPAGNSDSLNEARTGNTNLDPVDDDDDIDDYQDADGY